MIGAVALSLLDYEIDDKATEKEVKNLFEHKLPMYLHRAGRSRLDLSSPALDPTGVSAHGGNHQEDTMIINLNAEKALIAIAHAINHCSDSSRKPYKTILRLTYVEDLYDWKIYTTLGYSKSNYYRLRRKAFVEFAQILDYWKEKDGAYIPSTLRKIKMGQ